MADFSRFAQRHLVGASNNTVNPMRTVGKAALATGRLGLGAGRIIAGASLAMPLALGRNVFRDTLQTSGFNTVYGGAGDIFKTIAFGGKKKKKGKGKSKSKEKDGVSASESRSALKDSIDELKLSVDRLTSVTSIIAAAMTGRTPESLQTIENRRERNQNPTFDTSTFMGQMKQWLHDFKNSAGTGLWEKWFRRALSAGGLIYLGLDSIFNGKDGILAKFAKDAASFIFGDQAMNSFYKKMDELLGPERAKQWGDWIAKAIGVGLAGLGLSGFLPGPLRRGLGRLAKIPFRMIGRGISFVARQVGKFAAMIGSASWDLMKSGMSKLAVIVADLSKVIGKNLVEAASKLGDVVSDLASKFGNFFKNVVKALTPKFTEFFDDLMRELERIIPDFKKVPQRTPSGTFARGPQRVVDVNGSEIGRQMQNNKFLEAMDKAWENVKAKTAPITSKVPEAVKTGGGKALSFLGRHGGWMLSTGIEAYNGINMWNQTEEQYRAGLIDEAARRMGRTKAVAVPASALAMGLAGAGVGAAYSAPLAPFAGPFAPAVPIVGSLIGGALGAWGGAGVANQLVDGYYGNSGAQGKVSEAPDKVSRQSETSSLAIAALKGRGGQPAIVPMPVPTGGNVPIPAGGPVKPSVGSATQVNGIETILMMQTGLVP